MSISGSGAYPKPLKPIERIMVFIDGAYLRKLCMDYCKGEDGEGKDCTGFDVLYHFVQTTFDSYKISRLRGNPFRGDIIRMYYYDAIVDNKHPEYEKQKKYFDSILDNYPFYTVRLGKLESSDKKPKQKGVDILMSVDALTKAYLDQYDVGIFVMGDADFKPLIEAVKDTGKKTMGIYYPQNSAKDLTRVFDMRAPLDKEIIGLFTKHIIP